MTYDTLVLTRIDRLRDNLLLLAYLTLLGFLIVLTGRLGTRRPRLTIFRRMRRSS